MGLESGTSLAALDSTWPLSADYVQEGDNHIRLLKAVLKAQFPGVGGLGFAIPITATEAQLNFVAGVTSNIQAQLDALAAVQSFPSGTVMLFYQVAAPVGWTQISNDDNSMLRMVTGDGGGSGGSDSPIQFDYDTEHLHVTGDHQLTIAEMPVHSHTADADGGSTSSSSGTRFRREGGFNGTINTNSIGGGGVHNHGDTELAGGALSFSPRYIDIIQASKD